MDRYLDFLEERKKLLARAANAFMVELLHGEELPDLIADEEPEPAVAIAGAPAPEAPAANPRQQTPRRARDRPRRRDLRCSSSLA